MDVVDGIWEIDYDERVRKAEPVQIDITLPSLTFAQVSGSGDVTGLTPFTELEDLELKICGTGDMDLDLTCSQLWATITGAGSMDLYTECSSVESKITGSGNLHYAGSAPSHTIRITGSGKLQGYELATENTSISVTGSGDCEVNVQDNLDVDISGSGNVYYTGQPGINANITGTGRLINSN